MLKALYNTDNTNYKHDKRIVYMYTIKKEYLSSKRQIKQVSLNYLCQLQITFQLGYFVFLARHNTQSTQIVFFQENMSTASMLNIFSALYKTFTHTFVVPLKNPSETSHY